MIEADGLRQLEHDLAGAGLRAASAASEAIVDGANNITALAGDLATVGPTKQWSTSMRARATGTEREPQVGDLDVEVTNDDWAAHIIEFGTARMAPHAAIGPAFDRFAPDIADRIADDAAEALLP